MEFSPALPLVSFNKVPIVLGWSEWSSFLLYGALAATFTLVPYVLIENHGYSPVLAGAALAPIPVILGSMSRFMGGVAARMGPRWPLTIGPLVVAAGFFTEYTKLSKVFSATRNHRYWFSRNAFHDP